MCLFVRVIERGGSPGENNSEYIKWFYVIYKSESGSLFCRQRARKKKAFRSGSQKGKHESYRGDEPDDNTTQRGHRSSECKHFIHYVLVVVILLHISYALYLHPKTAALKCYRPLLEAVIGSFHCRGTSIYRDLTLMESDKQTQNSISAFIAAKLS